MAKTKYDRLLDQALKRRDATITEAREEYQGTVDAIERVRRLDSGPAAPAGTSDPNRARRGELAEAVKAAIGFMPRLFKLGDVADRIRQDSPAVHEKTKRTSVSSYLRRLVVDGVIQEHEKGRGKRPTVYRRPMAQPAETAHETPVGEHEP